MSRSNELSHVPALFSWPHTYALGEVREAYGNAIPEGRGARQGEIVSHLDSLHMTTAWLHPLRTCSNRSGVWPLGYRNLQAQLSRIVAPILAGFLPPASCQSSRLATRDSLGRIDIQEVLVRLPMKHVQYDATK